MPFYIYILHSAKATKYDAGYSHEPWKRLTEHSTLAHLTYTSKFGAWQLSAVFYTGELEGTAIRIERFIKKQKSKRLLEKLIDPHVRD